ncbi:DNA internalization-related competence protein ComEC/Rec2 [Rhodohalobacter sulfatireducens]|uniref:DNA internalization-related competence protein ComEC/Rec2 n=1 Tax=Rhodohalobacter sulfatireducens TaxID=2911366 RepID=A0ABS9K8I3_9BACT|nr:DNA internalization-related competence protein ComEC/Rec2 [Rhodohalobacter sulfatireducens]MCG2587164.1 DNA internalization-related competence protein ComEC/Rec2 [Rhodohalobacter sulfatireducens]
MRDRDSYRFPFAAYPAVRIMLLMGFGISIPHLLSLSFNTVLVLLAIVTAGWLLFEFILKKKFIIISSQFATIFYSLLVVTASMALASLQNEKNSIQIKNSEPIQFYEWEDLRIKGEIIESGKSTSGRDLFTMKVHETLLPKELTWKGEYKIRLYADSTSSDGLFVDDEAEMEISIYEFPEQRNPAGFDYGEWLHSQGISAHGELKEVIDLQQGGWLSFGKWRGHILQNIDQLFEPEKASLAKALLLGYKDDLTPKAKKEFARAGLSHIMAVSGLHVGFIVAPLWLAIPFLWGSKRGKWLGLIVLTLFLFLYAGITGFSPSVSRASLMAWLLTYGRLFHKVRNSINLTAVAAVILLLMDPNQLFDAGFQLSFGAVFIILLIMPEAQRFIPQKHQFRWTGGLISIILVSFVVQLGLFPILAAYFGEFSIVGPVSNALVIPLLTIVVPVGLVVIVSYSLLPEIFALTAIPLEFVLGWIEGVATITGGNSFSFISVGEVSITVFLIWLFAILTISTLRIPKLRWKIAICLLLAVNLLLTEQVIKESEPKKLRITSLDVGQGDAIHIETPNDKHLLVDAGRWSPGGNSGEEVILPYLKEKGIHRLDGVLLSHPHADHIGGMVEIIENVEVDTIYQTSIGYESQLFARYMEKAKQESIPIKNPVAGDIIEIDPSLRIFVIGPTTGSGTSNINNHSLAFKLVYGNTSALFSGDAEKQQETQLASVYGDFLESDLYKVGHHASNTSSTASFMEFVEPEITVASLGFENRFRHPGTETVVRLHKYSNEQNYTSLSGAIMYESDGKVFRKVKWRQ